MSTNFKANPIVAPNITRPGESSEYIGTRNVTSLLPAIFKTSVNTQFLNSTLEQLMTSGSLQAINSYIGAKNIGGNVAERYVDSVSDYQFTPGVVNKDQDNNITGVLTYDDMLNALEFNGSQIAQPNRVFNELGYTLDIPMNYDMFVNFHKYFWLIDYIPACLLEPTSGAPINIDDIAGKIYYTTPELENGKTLEFKNGMRVSFTGNNATGTDYEVDALYIVDGVGNTTGIKLTKQFNVSGNGDPFGSKVWRSDTIYRPDYKATTYNSTVNVDSFAIREYVVEQRFSQDQSAWARTNLWVKEEVVHSVCEYNDLDSTNYIVDGYRATRPIIEYRANIEKFNFGTLHKLTVSHMLDEITNPATQIVGQANWDIASYLITSEWDNLGYNKGDQVKVTMDTSVTYWDCIETHGFIKNPVNYENRKYWREITSTPLANGDLVLFINTTNTYNDKIFLVGGVGSSITLSEDATTINDYDKVLVVHGYNSVFLDSYDGYVYSGSEWHWDGDNWIYSQQKDARNGSLLFNLHDTDAVSINHDTTYPLSTFKGDRIFDYARSNGKIDEGLGFAPVYVDYGNNPGFRFDLGLGAKRYFYNIINDEISYQSSHDASSLEEIKGFYYYKRLDTNRYYNGWVNLRNAQPVASKIRHVINSSVEVVSVDIGTTNINLNNKYRFILNRKSRFNIVSENTLDENSKHIAINGTNPTIFMSRGKTYIIQTQFDNTDLEFVNVDGTALSGVTRTGIDGDTFSFEVAANQSADAFMYRKVSDNDVSGIVYVNSNTATTNLKVYVDGVDTTNYTISGSVVTLTSTYSINTVVDFVWYTTDLSFNENIKHGIADTHNLNPQNEWLASVTYGDLQAHIKEQMTNIPGFDGDYFGINNYNMLPHIHEFGGTIRKQAFSTELLAQTLMDVDTNPYAALTYATTSYVKFKKQLINKITQLHNTTPIETPVFELFDAALTSMNVGKPANSIFSDSDMIKYRDYQSVSYTITADDTTIFALPRTVNVYGDKRNHIQIWINDTDGGAATKHWRPLLQTTDYQIGYNSVDVNTTITFDTDGRAEVYIRWYSIVTPSFVPPSAVKLGILRPFIPQVLENFDTDSNGTVNDVIIGHDGSIHVLQTNNQDLVNRSSGAFSIEDAAIWELETRIFNNLANVYDIVIDANEIMPTANRSTPYSNDDLVAGMELEFNKWSTSNNINSLTPNDYYDGNNKFTWNYSSVSPYIGGYKGIYTYFFNTERPHTHPWEMIGFNKKPSWFDDAYTWLDTANGGDDAKRAALITILKYGHFNNPDEVKLDYSMHYSYSAYDWDSNILVNVDGTLNDPITAGIVTTPAAAQRAANFVFGDYGPVESKWRDSSYFYGAKILSLMKLRPLWILNNYFDSNRRSYASNLELDNEQILFEDSKLLGNYKDASISYTNYNDNIIEYVTVRNGGSGYTSTPTLKVYENFGRDAVLVPVVENEIVVAVSIQRPGQEYYSKPTIVASTGAATFDAFLLSGARKYFNGLSNAIIEFALFNKSTVEQIQNRFKSLIYTPVVKANGFINPNNQQFVLESSQNKGRVAIPEENYNSVLYTSQPKSEVFLSAVKITKSNEGYVVSGYDTSKRCFNYYTPNLGTRQTILTYTNLSVVKYRSFNSIPQKLTYNAVLTSLQDVYNLITGYAKYLTTQGWSDNWDDAAGQLLVWSSTAAAGDSTNVIPNANIININEGTTGYFDNIHRKYEGAYNLIDSNSKQILPNKVVVARDLLETENPITTITAKDNATKIYGVRLYKVNLEHVIVFDNTTSFDDVIYNPSLGQLHKRIIWNGSRTKEWNGRLYSPGYIVIDNTITNNFDTTAREIDQLYAQGTIPNNRQFIDLARFNTGYNKPNWAIQSDTDDNTAFNFTQGTKKYRGTKFALEAFMRNTSLFGLTANAELHENWAIRTADFGDTRSRETLEFQLYPDLLKTNPQPIRFSAVDKPDVLSDIVIDVDVNSPLLVTGTPGNNFTTRPAKTFSITTISEASVYANDFITAGLPLTTEADYTVINSTDFNDFPALNKTAYNFNGVWSTLSQWDNKTSYKFKDRVLYQGHTWEMLDPDGSSGLTRPAQPIEVSGTISLPVIPTAGQTLIIDNNTVTITKSSSSTTFNTITISGNNDISTTNVVTHGSTLILGATSNDAQTITFSNSVNTVEFGDIVVIGETINPQIVGSATKKLSLDGTNVFFDEIITTTTNITAKAGYEDAFNLSWGTNNTSGQRSSAATARITAINNLRTAYTGTWSTFLSTYFTASDAGLNIVALLAEYNTTPSYAAQLEALVGSELTIINNITTPGVLYLTASVLAGSQVVASQDIIDSQIAMEAGLYTTDIKNWLTANPTTAFTATTIVDSQVAGTFKTYTLTEIVNKINAENITNITASSSSSRLAVTKTTLDDTTQFSFLITSASANSEVGLVTSTTTFNATGITLSSTPNLTQSQVIAQINAANITGITAAQSTISSIRLGISCSNTTIYIGNGTANTAIGINAGVTQASTTVTTVPISSDLASIVNSINIAEIEGVTASNSNNKLKIASTNDTLVLGAGTANSTVGLTAQTFIATTSSASNVFNAIVGSDGNQVFRQMDNDPNIFSIWVADNRNINEEYNGYAVYQAMDFGMYIMDACAGVTAADDAEITVTMPAGVTHAHNLTTNDYVLIRGSTTVPSIDGIHKVTGVKSSTTFYIDVYLEEEGGTGNIYPMRNVRFSSYAELFSSFNLKLDTGIYKYNFSGYRQNNTQTPILAFVDNDDFGNPAVYRYFGNFSNISGHYNSTWVKVRTSLDQARNDLIKNVKIYNKDNNIVTLETWDPAKGIIPGFIDREIDFKTTADMASYNYDNINGFIENTKSWGENQIGMRWWDISTAIYLDYEQSNIEYQHSNWGNLFTGASIDIYEWTSSPVLPDQWADFVLRDGTINGIVASGESYSINSNGEKLYQWTEEISYNPRNNLTTSTYYFWVKSKTTTSNGNYYSIFQIANILKDPDAFDISWCAASGSDYLLISNIDNYVTHDTVVQINQTYESNALPLNEWTLLSDNDSDSPIPEQLHIKMRDNIVGYNLNTIRYLYTVYSLLETYSIDDVVGFDTEFYISLSNNNIGKNPYYFSDNPADTYWKRIYDYSLPQDTAASDIDIVVSRSLPDLNLHPMNRYGHLIRPQQSMFVNIEEARHNFIDYVNYLINDICLVSDINNWDVVLNSTFVEGGVTYDISKYWNYVDWSLVERSVNNEVLFEYDITNLADMTVESKFDLINSNTVYSEDTYVYVRNAVHKDNINRPEVYRYVNSEWVLVWKRKGTIKFSEELWYQSKFGHGFDTVAFDVTGFDSCLGNILGKIFDELRNRIFVSKKYRMLYNKLWFTCLSLAVSENTVNDFAFKTTFVDLKVLHPVLVNTPIYQNYTMDAIEQFFNDIKPFHTKLRSSIEAVTYTEATEVEITEQDRTGNITILLNDHSLRTYAADTILTGGDFTGLFEIQPYVIDGYMEDGYIELRVEEASTEPLNDDGSLFTTTTFNYIYDGDGFIDPVNQGWGNELYPIDFIENIRVLVQTNTSGDIVDSDTRTFQINYFAPYDLEDSIAIVDAAKTALDGAITASATTIEVTDGAVLTQLVTADNKGVVWIDKERIEYDGIDGNTLLYCTRGTRGTGDVAHETGAVVLDGGYLYRVPILDNFVDYGNGLRMAYNDTGVSLSTAGITPEHAFIRNAGLGTV